MNWQCPWRHSRDWHRGRDASGQSVKLCDRCLQPIEPLLTGEMLAEPLPQVVAGEPTGKARRVTRANVAPWKVSNR